MNRRTFIQHGLTGMALIGAGPMLAGCSGTGRTDIALPAPSVPTAAGLDTVRLQILHYAALAPSGHNSQPWAVRIQSADEWIVEADPARRLPAVDPENREAMLSIGAFAENLSLAAGAAGFNCDLAVLSENAFDQDILRVRLRTGRPTGYPLARLETRRTLKHGLRPETIRADDLAILSDPLGGRLHYFARGTRHAECLRQGTVENFRAQSRRDETQIELTDWLRLSRTEARRHRDGLTVEGMEIQGVAGWFVRSFVKPSDFLKPSYREKSIDTTARMASEGGGWFVITSPGSSVADLIDTGRRFQRMALLARERRIAIHPMTQILEEPEGRQAFKGTHPGGIIPQFVLRVGYLDRYPEPVSLRRPVSWFLKPASSA
jgi:hypothetical protein